MLSFTEGIPIARIQSTNDLIYINDNDMQYEDMNAEIDTTNENKIKIFKNFLKKEKKLFDGDYEKFLDYYEKSFDEDTNKQEKIHSKYYDIVNKVNESLKKNLKFPKNIELFPIINKPSYRMTISGLSGS